MKRLGHFLILEMAISLTSCLYCFDKEAYYTYIDVHSVGIEMVADYTQTYDSNDTSVFKSDLHFSIFPDSISDYLEIVSSGSFTQSLMACDDNNHTFYNQTMDSLQVYTLYDLNSEFPAGAVINEVLSIKSFQSLSYLDINVGYEASGLLLKLAVVPKSDTVQFLLTGRLSNNLKIMAKTSLRVFN
ncbi:MAG: hypothetical protein RIA69_07430 [Cyclobacteriaceae bacterium]